MTSFAASAERRICHGADLSKRSARRISGSYINRIENYPNLGVTADRLKALADGLGVPAEELFARVVGFAPEGETSEEIELLARFRDLSPERRDDVLRIVDRWYQKHLIEFAPRRSWARELKGREAQSRPFGFIASPVSSSSSLACLL